LRGQKEKKQDHVQKREEKKKPTIRYPHTQEDIFDPGESKGIMKLDLASGQSEGKEEGREPGESKKKSSA